MIRWITMPADIEENDTASCDKCKWVMSHSSLYGHWYLCDLFKQKIGEK